MFLRLGGMIPKLFEFERIKFSNFQKNSILFQESFRSISTFKKLGGGGVPTVSSSLKRPKDGGFKIPKRFGRGGQGKTAGRGRKGWKAKHSQARPHKAFEGGQSGLVKKIPKLGVQHKSVLSTDVLRPLPLDKLQLWIDKGRLPTVITMRDLCLSGICGRVRDGIVLVAKGQPSLKTPVTIQVTKCTPQAYRAITSLGGSVSTIYTDKAYIHHITSPEKYMETFKGTYLGVHRKKVFARYPDMIADSGDDVLKKVRAAMSADL